MVERYPSHLECVKNLCKNANYILNKNYEKFVGDFADVKNLIILLKGFGAEIDRKTVEKFSRQITFGKLTLEKAEQGLQCMIDKPFLVGTDGANDIKNILKKYGLLNRGKVCLNLNLKLKNKLISSMGKLDSIAKIVDVEHKNLGSGLRMLILTDYIKKSNLKGLTFFIYILHTKKKMIIHLFYFILNSV